MPNCRLVKRCNLSLTIALAWSGFVVGLCSIPGKALVPAWQLVSEVAESAPAIAASSFVHIDKAFHFGMFAVFASLWMAGDRSWQRQASVLLGALAWGGLTELEQGLWIAGTGGGLGRLVGGWLGSDRPELA